MNLKLIINLFIFLFSLLFLLSCESLDLLSEEEKQYEREFDIKEFKTEIILNIYEANSYVEDFYSDINLKNLNNENKFIKIATFRTKRNKNQISNNLTSFIYEDKFIYLDLKSTLNIFNMKDLDLIKSIDLKSFVENNDAYPTSISRIKDTFFVSFSKGMVLNFNLQGELIWSKDFKKIIKTPIKIYDNNLIILLGNDIISINPSTGEIIWEFSYGNNEIFQVMGGDIINLNHLLFFILPDGTVGEINTIFREKNKSIFSKYNFENSINNSYDKVHSFNNTLSYFDQRKYLYSFDVGKNQILLKSEEIENINSFKFYNNTIFLLDKNNLLKTLNIINKKLFWKIDLLDLIEKDDVIIHVSNLLDSLIVIFESGNIIELNNLNGNIISSQKLKINKISHVQSSNNLLILYHNNNKITLFTQ